MDRDYILISKGMWHYFSMIYGGMEVKRYSITKDKHGGLYRTINLPRIKVTVMKRGEQLIPARWVHVAQRTSVQEFKMVLKDCLSL